MSTSRSTASVIRKIAYTRHRYLVVIILALVVLPLYVAMAMPVPVTETVQAEYDFIKTIKPGDYALLQGACKAMDWPMYRSVYIGLFTEILKRGGKVIFFESDITVLADHANLMKYTPYALQLETTPGRGYGVDWIILALHPGDEASLISLFSNLWIGEKDAKFGKSYSTYPIMTKVKSAADIKLFHQFGCDFKLWMRLLVDTYGVGYIGLYTEDFKVEATQFIRLGRMKGAVMGMADTAAFELLTGTIGPGLVSANTLNFYGLLMLGCMIIGNLAAFTAKKEEKKMEVPR